MARSEILAPVGGREQLLAAVRCGADAVYLGARGFNARRNAENFDEYSLAEAVAFCHGRGVRVHVTVNTLVMDDEMDALEETVRQVADSGADAVIIQDPAVMRLFRDRCPTIQRHASTQMAVHNIDGAKLMQELGFHRVVLARELSLREIEAINRAVDIETEVFVHGAHCMSVSGACYLSAMLGGRSGNRGLCAQPCRLDFRQNGREYALSLKDLSFITHMQEIMNAGTYSFKIEGRMKRPEYVAAAVTACRDALEGREPDLDRLQAVFSRSGFTDEYLTGKRSAHMFGYRRHEDVTAANSVFGELAGLYRAERQSVPVDLRLTMTAESSRLTATDGVHTVAVTGDVPQPARTRATDKDAALKNLGKTGGTPFALRMFSAEIGEGLMLPASALNALRRDALAALLAARETIVPHELASRGESAFPAHKAVAEPALRARFETAAQLPEDPAVYDKIILPIEELERSPVLIAQLGDRLIGELPALLFPTREAAMRETLQTLKAQGLTAVQTENAYGLHLGRELGLRVHGGFGLNILNSAALSEYESLGLQDATISFELAVQKIRRLGGGLPRGILAYGHLPLMRLRACPAKAGCKTCNGRPTLRDRMDVEFPLLCHDKQYTTMLNSVPLYIGDKDYRGVDFVTLYFTKESAAECAARTALFRRGAEPNFQRTNGLYFRTLQ
ncbi:MAG: U32 family peptidase [Ruminococcaceae bacterium]|nr:U32 family peptidase [Oscillospiraceae bacterium]